MSNYNTIQAAYAAFANNDPSVLFGAMSVLGRYGGAMKHDGAKLDAPFCHVYRFEGGRIGSCHQYTDTEEWARLMP